MKLLLDENLSRRLIPFLQHDYPDSTQIALMGLESASDTVVWQTAKQDGYVIVTRDADFQELSQVWGQPPKIIWLKTKNPSRAATLKLFRTYALMRATNSVNGGEDGMLSDSVADENTDPSPHRQMHVTDVPGFFDERAKINHLHAAIASHGYLA